MQTDTQTIIESILATKPAPTVGGCYLLTKTEFEFVSSFLQQKKDIEVSDGKEASYEEINIVTEAMRDCDVRFETTGGSTRHYVRDLLLPYLADKGYKIVRSQLSAKDKEKDGWISVFSSAHQPEIGKYYLVNVGQDTVLKGRLMNNGWTAFFADGEKLVSEERFVTHYKEMPDAPANPENMFS